MIDPDQDSATTQTLKSDTPSAPPASPPTVDFLNQRVAGLRRRRQIIRATTSTAAVVCLFVLFSLWQPTESHKDGTGAVVAETSPPPATTFETAEPKFAAPSSQPIKIQPSKVQLYASISQSVPVFDVNEETQTIHHVGWVESNQEVPVNMNYVPENQQDSFNAYLNEDDTWHFSL